MLQNLICLAVFYTFLPPLLDSWVRLHVKSGLLFSNSIHIPPYLFFSFYLLFSVSVLVAAWPQESEPNRILLVTIHHMIYPITVEVLHQVFKAYGFVEKIVTFQKSAGQIFLLSLSFTTHTYTWYAFSDSLIDCM
jgi:hypothetical protein